LLAIGDALMGKVLDGVCGWIFVGLSSGRRISSIKLDFFMVCR
jgi:hypothetical protein